MFRDVPVCSGMFRNVPCSGFYRRPNRPAIVDIVSAIHSNMDKRLFSCGIFIDSKKAFDKVNHQILLNFTTLIVMVFVE